MRPFERVFVINLRRRPDRLRAFWKRWEACDWPNDWPRPEVCPAVDGDVVGVPAEFTAGGGAYGCRMSHLRVLQDCLMEGLSSVFVLEDDADLRPGFGPAAVEFLSRVPDDWEGIMPGGQHQSPPQPVAGRPGVVRVEYAQRTHAYVARGRYLRDLQRRWGHGTVHIDWRMKGWQHRYTVYAPSRWLIGQAGGRSDIRGVEKPPEWWNEPAGDEPLVLLRAPREVIESLRGRGFYAGFDRDPETGYDTALAKCLATGDPAKRKTRLARWLRTIPSRCAGGTLLGAVWHPAATRAELTAVWHGPVVEITADSPDDVLSKLPAGWRERLESSAVHLPPVVPQPSR